MPRPHDFAVRSDLVHHINGPCASLPQERPAYCLNWLINLDDEIRKLHILLPGEGIMIRKFAFLATAAAIGWRLGGPGGGAAVSRVLRSPGSP